MKIAYNWLTSYVKTTLNPEKLADRFVFTSSEVEDIINWRERYTGIIVGQVIEVDKHPNADKLSITKVNVGHKDFLTIVCGAPNVVINQKVPVAQIGATIYTKNNEGFQIKEVNIRGQKSQGMICSAQELGLADASDGIMELPENAEIGKSFAEYLHLDDTVLDLEITPNRPDLMSYLGLAREVSAFDKKELIEPDLAILEDQKLLTNPLVIEIEDTKIASRFSVIYMENYIQESSPSWMQSRLRLSGIKPVNLIVDITNYVMLEMGQPLHAYDYDQLTTTANNKKAIKIRSGVKNETISILDNTTRTITPNDIIIAGSSNEPIAIAGIMGGKTSSISANSNKIALESATFSGSLIRNTSRRLGIRTEASSRFEKGIDSELTIKALKRAVFLLQSIQPQITFSNIADIHSSYKKERPKIHLTFNQISQVVGINIPSNETKNILCKLGFQINNFTKSGFETIPPSWRSDVSINEDVIEELVRIWGFDRIPSTLPSGKIHPPMPNKVFTQSAKIRKALSAFGYNETLHVSLTSEENIIKTNMLPKDCISAQYPLSREMEKLIPSHLPNLMKNLATVNHFSTEIKLFEIGHIFSPNNQEKNVLSMIIQTQNSVVNAIRDLKSDLQKLITSLGVDQEAHYSHVKSSIPYYIPESIFNVLIENMIIGTMGEINQNVKDQHKIKGKKRIIFAQFEIDHLATIPQYHKKYQEELIFPSIYRDLTVVLSNSFSCQELATYIQENKPNLLHYWNIDSVFSDNKTDQNDSRSITIHLEYNGQNCSLTDSQVNEVQNDLEIKLINKFNLSIK